MKSLWPWAPARYLVRRRTRKTVRPLRIHLVSPSPLGAACTSLEAEGDGLSSLAIASYGFLLLCATTGAFRFSCYECCQAWMSQPPAALRLNNIFATSAGSHRHHLDYHCRLFDFTVIMMTIVTIITIVIVLVILSSHQHLLLTPLLFLLSLLL